jgi:hypothetical protein
MGRLIFLILISGTFNLATAQVCTQIADDEERLACFDAALACAAIRSESGRLECFDNAVSGSRSSDVRVDEQNISQDEPAEPESPVAQSTQVQVADDDKVPDAARSSAPPEVAVQEKTSEVPEEIIEAVIVEVRTNVRDIDYLSLDNGQVWRETEDSLVRFRVGRKVTIKEGIFGSRNLTMEGIDRNAKVTRVK